MAVANCHGGVACVLCVTSAEPLHLWVIWYLADRSHGWQALANHHSAHWPWRDGQSHGQRVLAGGVLDFTHRIQILQCTLGFVIRNYCDCPGITSGIKYYAVIVAHLCNGHLVHVGNGVWHKGLLKLLLTYYYWLNLNDGICLKLEKNEFN